MARKLLLNGLHFRVGKRNRINIWEDPGVPNNPSFKPSPMLEEVCQELGMVNSLRHPDRSWNLEKLQHLFDPIMARNICKISPTNLNMKDKII